MKKTKLCFESGSEGRQGRTDDTWGGVEVGGRKRKGEVSPSFLLRPKKGS